MIKVFLIVMLLMNIHVVNNDKYVMYVNESILMNDDIGMAFEEASLENKLMVEEVIEESQEQENDVLVGRMSGYGPDCYGCSGYLAYGPYVGDGIIYYNDSEYGMIRIVAGDRSLPFGTIIKVNDSFNAIVLDRGGAIGIGKSFLFDLLYPSEAEANENGILVDATFEILRYGF